MKNSQNKYAFVKIRYNINRNQSLIEYLKSRNTPFSRILLDSLSMLWMPYVLDNLQSPRKELEKGIEISYETLVNHFNLMCLHLNYDLSNLKESRVPLISNHKLNSSNLYESRASPIYNHKSKLSRSFNEDIGDIEEEKKVDYLALINNDMQF